MNSISLDKLNETTKYIKFTSFTINTIYTEIESMSLTFKGADFYPKNYLNEVEIERIMEECLYDYTIIKQDDLSFKKIEDLDIGNAIFEIKLLRKPHLKRLEVQMDRDLKKMFPYFHFAYIDRDVFDGDKLIGFTIYFGTKHLPNELKEFFEDYCNDFEVTEFDFVSHEGSYDYYNVKYKKEKKG